MRRWALIVLLAAALAASLGRSARLRGECEVQRANCRVLTQRIVHYTVRDSLHAASLGVLTVRAGQLERQLASLTRDMGVKLRRLEALSQTAAVTRVEFSAPLRDTVVSFDNGHVSLEGVVGQDRFYGRLISRDTLTQVVWRVPRRFLFIRYGTRELRQSIVCSNPHTEIVYARSIRIEKRR